MPLSNMQIVFREAFFNLLLNIMYIMSYGIPVWGTSIIFGKQTGQIICSYTNIILEPSTWQVNNNN